MKNIITLVMMVMMVLPVALALEPTAPILYTRDAQFLTQDPDPAEPGKYVDVRIKIQNIGRDVMRDFIFQLVPEYPFSLLPGDDGIRSLGTVDAGQIGENSYVLFYRLSTDASALGGSYPIRLRYSINGGDTWSRLEDFSLRVKSGDSIVAVRTISTSPEIIAPGKNFRLDIGIENIGNSYIKKVRLNLGLVQPTATGFVEMPFSPIGSTNEKVIEIMDKGKKETISYNLIVSPDADAKTYKVPIEITYTDDGNIENTLTQLLSIKVGVEPQLAVYLDRDEPFIIGKTDTLTVRFVNRGLGNIKFLYATLDPSDDHEIVSSSNVYVGSINSDDYETAEFKVRCTECMTDKRFNINIEYLDDSNNMYQKSFELTERVYSIDEAKKAGLIKESNTTGIVITVVIVIVGVIVYRSIRKRKKNAR